MIGIFDSGYGGLTIARVIHQALPEYSTIYLGDNARAPYGERSDAEILEFTKQGVDTLFQRGCVLVILGCNTASAAALRILQQQWLPQMWPDKRILGILVPTVEAISSLPHEHVSVLATAHTVATNAYEREIHKLNSNIQVTQHACTNLAGMIESFGADDERVQESAKRCVDGFVSPPARGGAGVGGSIDAVLLGCTHYDFVADYIQSLLPPETVLIRQPNIVAKSLQDYLFRHPEIDSCMDKTGNRTYLTTGNLTEVSIKSTRLLGEKTTFNNKGIL